MGILSFFTSCKEQNDHQRGATHSSLTVDLGTLRIGSTLLGKSPSASDPFHSVLTKEDVFEPKGQGVEIGTKDGLLDYGFFTVDSFRGTFTRSGQSLDVGENTTENDVRQIFGEPYWIDRSDGEVIMFYEYQAGTVEIQFEFSDGGELGFITLSRNGVLSDPEDRKSYGVNKPWPPQ